MLNSRRCEDMTLLWRVSPLWKLAFRQPGDGSSVRRGSSAGGFVRKRGSSCKNPAARAAPTGIVLETVDPYQDVL